MRRLLAFALVLLPALPALATSRTFALSTLVATGGTALKPSETHITVRGPKNSKISQALSPSIYVPVQGHLNASHTSILYTLGSGGYYTSPTSKLFAITQ